MDIKINIETDNLKLDSIKISGNESKNLQKLFKETKSPIFEQQFTQYLVNSYKTSEFLLSKNSNAENNPCLPRISIEDTPYKTNIPSYSVSNHNETLLILKKFLFFSKIFKMPYNVYKKSINNFQKSSNLWKYNANLETNLAKFMHSDVSLIPFQVNSEWQDAGYFADEIVFLLERRISFRQIKNRIFKQFSLNPYIQGVRITCSGRVGGKSKKAQRARVDSIKYGQTSLHIFSSRIDFAARTAYTLLGSTGVKVWVCYK
jgi:ribosomal protein S3